MLSMEIDVSNALLEPGREFSFSYAGPLDLDEELSGLTADVTAKYVMENGIIRVSGQVLTALGAVCSRCGNDVALDVDERFDELFTEDAEDESTYSYNRSTRRLSLDQMLRDIVLTAVPMQILCRDDCRGLCPECGANLNDGPCGCAPADDSAEVGENNPFAKLKNLF